jgi:ATP-dependent DNA helicase RecQ
VDPWNDLLRGRFGVENLRTFQRDAVAALLGGDDPPQPDEPRRVLVVAPTGGGKSLCYQLPALMLEGTALVLSPLIALMEDQVRGLVGRGIAATYLASTLPRAENARRLAALRRGAYRIVYVAPERLSQPGFLETLLEARISLVAVDEAHCIVQWGHDFRPDCLRLGAALARLRPPRVLACTATATPDARAEIARALGWEGAPFTLVLRGFARPNLHLGVRPVSGPREAQQETARAVAEALGGAARPTGAAIVYAASRRGAEVLAERLGERGFRAGVYHAGLDPAARAQVSAAFAARELPVVVATNAFGMGIDRPDVRIVVHAQPPGSIEAYYQEVGRAGRDGAPARGLLLLSAADLVLRRRLCHTGEGGARATAADAARAWDRFRAMLSYVDAATCRHDYILRHFGDEAESLGGCGHCDVCLALRDPTDLDDDRDVIRRALAGVARARGAVGLSGVAAMLAGEGSRLVLRAGLDQLSTFGVLAGRTPDEVMAVLRALLANGWIDLSEGDFPVPRITPLGFQVARGEVVVRVLLPRSPRRAIGRERAAVQLLLSGAAAPAPPLRAAGRQGAAAQLLLSGAAAPAPPLRAPADPPAVEPAGSEAALLAALRGHRTAVARARAVPPYVVAPDRTLAAIAAARPRTGAELLDCHGMGPGRLAAYGEGLLAVVQAHAPGRGVGVREAAPAEAAPALDRGADRSGRSGGAPGADDLAYARFWQRVQRV